MLVKSLLLHEIVKIVASIGIKKNVKNTENHEFN
jgi:hypothetical protein